MVMIRCLRTVQKPCCCWCFFKMGVVMMEKFEKPSMYDACPRITAHVATPVPRTSSRGHALPLTQVAGRVKHGLCHLHGMLEGKRMEREHKSPDQ